MISHLENDPGFTGKGSRMDIQPIVFTQLLSSQEYSIIIPLIQRKYCWTDEHIEGWWRDGALGRGPQISRTSNGCHRTGKVIFKRGYGSSVASYGETPQLLCVDGQQRCTTQSILLACIRDFALGLTRTSSTQVQSCAQNIVDATEKMLVMNVDVMRSWCYDKAEGIFKRCILPIFETENQSEILSDNDLESVLQSVSDEAISCFPVGCNASFDGGGKLVPSYVDRASYFMIILSGRLYHELMNFLSKCPRRYVNLESSLYSTLMESSNESRQHSAKAIFDKLMKRRLQTVCEIVLTSVSFTDITSTETLQSIMKELTSIFNNASRMQLMYCEILSEVNLSQVFLWLQEKTLFGMGALLYNPSPGVNFNPSDLARNLLLSSFMNRDIVEQEEIYRTRWLEPIEMKLSKSTNNPLDALLTKFLASKEPPKSFLSRTSSQRYIGSFETQVTQMNDALPLAMKGKAARDSPIGIYSRFHSCLEGLELQKMRSRGATDSGVIISEETCLEILDQLSKFVSE